ncbi:MAG: 16S rRNA (guanine1207-N2)-methyltransferase/23S rRNA (guanine1835-N2)-methyltransferase [Alphaproteobacteria bacterium]|jgi:16S rRNA (guanine1207-N2)-methyltransferase/23S rRNA (guanine1835-N2)-methyltransferase
MNNTQLHIQDQTFSLKRFPSNQFDKSLRAWDAADEYMIDHVANTLTFSELKHIVIVNDSFGALACAMARLAPLAKISVFTDSYMTERGIAQNLKGSNLDKNNVSVHSSLELSKLVGQSVDVVLLKVPRTLAYLDYMLLTLSAVFAHTSSTYPSPMLIGGAMVKLVTSSAMKIFDSRMTNTTSSLARKKARLIFAECKQPAANETTSAQILALHTSSIHEVQDSEIDFTLYNYPNVFCREQVDIGARYMLQVLPQITKKNQVVIDLGCGNGILGTSLLLKHKNNPPKVIYIDESHMAIESAKATLMNSNANEQAKADAEFLVGHCLDEFIAHNKNGADLVICNPPFHQQNTVVDDIAWQMFVDAKKVLKVGGELRIVGNRHLDHRAKLSKLFGGCHVIASDKKFVVLSSLKQGSVEPTTKQN